MVIPTKDLPIVQKLTTTSTLP